MNRKTQKVLSMLLVITMVVCALPQNHAYAMENADYMAELDETMVLDHLSNLTVDKLFPSFATNVYNYQRDMTKSIQQLTASITAFQYISYANMIVNGVVSILQMTGVIQDPTMEMLESIMEAINDLRADIEKIDKRITQIKSTLDLEFANTDYKLDTIRAELLRQNWSDFMGGEYENLRKLSEAYEERLNKSAVEWAKTWRTENKTDLRAIYNRKGLLLYNGENYAGCNAPLPVTPAASDDTKTKTLTTDVAFSIVLPAEYFSIDAGTSIDADNYMELIRKAVLAGVKQAYKDKVITVDAENLIEWGEFKTEDDITAKIADDLVNSIFYEISNQIANSEYGGTSFSNAFLSAFRSFCDAVNGTNGRSSAMGDILDYLSFTMVFEGEAKEYAARYEMLIGMATLQFGTLTSSLVAMNPNIKSSAKTELAELICNTMKRSEAIYQGFFHGGDNYCYPLEGFLSFVDVSAQFVVKTHTESLWREVSVSDWTLVDKALDIGTDDLDVYRYEAEKNETLLKDSMVNARNLTYLYYYIHAIEPNRSILDFLGDNGVITTGTKHSTTLLTPEYEVKEYPLTNKTKLVSYPVGYGDLEEFKPESGYEEGKYATPLFNPLSYRTEVNDRLVGTLFSIDGSASDGTTGTGVSSRESTDATIATRVVQRSLATLAPCYLFSDDMQVNVLVSEEAMEDAQMAPLVSEYTAVVSRDYGALVVNYEKNADSYDYQEVIKNKDDFGKFLKNIANGNTYEGKHVLLAADIDMAGVDPEKYWGSGECKKEFRGYFNGDDHTISNFTFDSTEHRVGLFRTTGKGAVIENLSLKDVNIGAKENKNARAALVGYANGDLTVKNVTVTGTVSGYKYVGGIIGNSNENAKIIVLNCMNNANVTSRDADAGGILGNVGEFYLDDCKNYGKITAIRGGAGGMCGYTNKKTFARNCVNDGDVTGYDCAGGICGHIASDSRFMKFINNVNFGRVTAETKGSAGGIVGWTDGGGDYFLNKNSGEIVSKNSYAGGILGGNEDDGILLGTNTNTASVTGLYHTGGIVGYLGDKDHDKVVVLKGNSNYGTITATSASDGDAGGIAGAIATDNTNHTVSNNGNEGTVNAERQAGGIVGWMAGGGMFDSNANSAEITSKNQNAGGIVGKIEDDKCQFRNSNIGGTSVKAENTAMHAGKICGWDGVKKASINSDSLFATVFGEGSVVIILAMLAVIVIAVVVIVSRRKKKAE